MALTKKAIVRSIQQRTGSSYNHSYECLETTLEIIKNTFSSGEDVKISGFGKFKLNDKSARKGRNPVTGETMMLKPRKVVTFQCSGKLRERLNT